MYRGITAARSGPSTAIAWDVENGPVSVRDLDYRVGKPIVFAAGEIGLDSSGERNGGEKGSHAR